MNVEPRSDAKLGSRDEARLGYRDQLDQADDILAALEEVVEEVAEVAGFTINQSGSPYLTKSVIQLTPEQTRQLRLSQTGLSASFEPQTIEHLVQNLVEEIVKVAHLEKKGLDNNQIEKLKEVARYVLTNYETAFGQSQKDDYMREFSVPVIRTKEGFIAVPLKKSGKLDTGGANKRVRDAVFMKLTTPQGQGAKLEITWGVSATISEAQSPQAAHVEKEMMTRVKDINHPNIIECVTVTEYMHKETEAKKVGIIMKYCNGGDLEKYTANTSGSDEEKFLICEGVLNGLSYLHEEAGIFHSDIKPANILLIKDDEGKVIGIKITDFGCARDIRQEENPTYFSGDPSYLSPELKQLVDKMEAEIAPFLQEEKQNRYLAEQDREAKAMIFYKTNKSVDKLMIESSELQKEMQSNPDPKLAEAFKETEGKLRTAQSDLIKARKDWEDAKEKYQKADSIVSKKRNPLIEERREKLYMIDEGILKSDVYAAGLVFEKLFENEKDRLTPEMKQLIAEMKTDDVSKRISAKEAHAQFKALQEQGLILSPERSDSESDDEQLWAG